MDKKMEPNMNISLLRVAIELLHRDPDIINQETKTAVRKFFGERANVDDLLSALAHDYDDVVSKLKISHRLELQEKEITINKLEFRIFELEKWIAESIQKPNRIAVEEQ